MYQLGNWLKNHFWISVLLGMITLTLLIKVFFLSEPWTFIFAVIAFFTLIPISWKRYGGGEIAEFWKNITGKTVRIFFAIVLFFLVRAFFSYFVNFTPFSSYVLWTKSSWAGNVFSYTPGKILYEVTFLILVGLLCLDAFFKGLKSRAAKIVGTFLAICFFLQTFYFGANKTDEKVLEEKKAYVTDTIEQEGVIGGGWALFKRVSFGKSEPKKTELTATQKEPKINLTIELQKGEEKGTVVIPDKTTLHFSSNHPFIILERSEYNLDGNEKLRNVDMPAGQSSRYFAWGGTLNLKGEENNTIITID